VLQPRDYGPFPYIRIKNRPKLEWPGGALVVRCRLGQHDQPYFMDVGGRRLVSIPYSYEINDAPHFSAGTARSTSSKR
jgi:hypothetical protein